MKVIYVEKDFANLDKFLGKLDLCLGFFDGFHLGHQTLVKYAKENGSGALGIITFRETFKRSVALTSLDDRLRLFSSFGIDVAYVLPPFNDIKDLSPEEFIDKFLLKISPAKLFMTDDFTFGKNASGNHKNLEPIFDVHIVPYLKDIGEKISTRGIIQIIEEEGNVSKANSLLGRNYEVTGKVIRGFGLGRKIGYPTANINLSANYALPKNGVYSVLIYIDGIPFKGMANVGTHPTVNQLEERLLEVHILDFDRDIYDRTVYVSFVARIRDEKRFSSLDELKEQIKNDIEKIR